MIKNKIRDVERFHNILRIVVKNESGYLLERTGLDDHLPYVKRLQVRRHDQPGPERLRETCEELGTTFIKLGQMLANRPDVTPPEYVEELEKLEYSVKPFDWVEAEEIIEEDVGLDKFENICEEAMASASIAQVHEAKLKNGDSVVLKVRRPGIEDEIRDDLDILRFAVKKACKHSEKVRDMKADRIVERFCEWTTDELDFEKEARNAEVFRNTLPDDENARVPDIYHDLSTKRVLVMEKIDGIKCTDVEGMKEKGIDIEDVTDTILGVGIKQTVVEGYFHGDPHPSNFLIESSGTVVYIDFGITGTISKKERDLMGLMVVHMVNEDIDSTVDALTELGTVDEDADIDKLKELVTEKVVEIKNTTVAEASISRKMVEIAIESSKLGVHLPDTVVLVGKDLMTIEGIAMKVRPDSQMDDQVREVAMEALKRSNTPEDMADSFAVDLLKNKDLFTKLPTKINKKLEDSQTVNVENHVSSSERDLKTASLILGTSILGVGGALITDNFWPLLAVAGLIFAYFLRF